MARDACPGREHVVAAHLSQGQSRSQKSPVCRWIGPAPLRDDCLSVTPLGVQYATVVVSKLPVPWQRPALLYTWFPGWALNP